MWNNCGRRSRPRQSTPRSSATRARATGSTATSATTSTPTPRPTHGSGRWTGSARTSPELPGLRRLRRMASPDRLRAALAAIDEANADDPNVVTVRDRTGPKEVVHAELVTEWVLRLKPNAD